MGHMFTVSFQEVSVGTPQQDLIQIEAKTVPAIVHAVYVSQSSDVGDAVAEGLSILIRRVTDAVTDSATEVKLDQSSPAANAGINVNQTTELVAGAEIVHSEVWNIALPFVWLPPPEMRIIIPIDSALTVNLNTTTADAITASATLYWEEIGS